MRRLAAVGIACYLVALLLAFPASVALRWAPQPLRMTGISGSIWRGEADAASIGTTYLGATSWQARPLGWLRGRVAYRVEARQGATEFFTGIFGLGWGKVVYIDELRAACSLRTLAQLLPPEIPATLFQGDAQLKLDGVRIESGWPRRGRGDLRLVDLALVSPPEPLGSYVVEIDNGEDGVLRGNFRDTGDGPLEIRGSITLNDQRSYDLRCSAEARANASATLRASVGMICPQS